jgi:putrescine aminotransferase
MGRTGPLFAVHDEGVVPDVLLAGKSLAGGIVPIGAMLARRGLWARFGLTFSMSASSFSGNRLACVAALAALAIVERSDVLDRGRAAGVALRKGLDELRASHPDLLRRVTGRGLLLGLHFATPAAAGEVIRLSIREGLLVAAAFCNNRCILLEPPLVVNEEQVGHALSVLAVACDDVAARTAVTSATRRGNG